MSCDVLFVGVFSGFVVSLNRRSVACFLFLFSSYRVYCHPFFLFYLSLNLF